MSDKLIKEYIRISRAVGQWATIIDMPIKSHQAIGLLGGVEQIRELAKVRFPEEAKSLDRGKNDAK